MGASREGMRTLTLKFDDDTARRIARLAGVGIEPGRGTLRVSDRTLCTETVEKPGPCERGDGEKRRTHKHGNN